ncbi:uncharacterized protein TrAFT101_005297 [Trichoderma asperellum]|uniref:uncharacterized protein n=1 Tax=Trichoderma asperellum TaxID=101201 RepID=UPI00331FF7F2|nr:hypothetical protein TrAFT101_005297 [Trichoderma asperellum]
MLERRLQSLLLGGHTEYLIQASLCRDWVGTGTSCGCHVSMSPLGKEEPSLLLPSIHPALHPALPPPLHPSSILWPIRATHSRLPVKAGKSALLLPACLYS